MTDENISEIGRALGHPLRLAIVREFRRGKPLSPNGLSNMLGSPLGNVSYHCNALLDASVITLDTTVPRRGALEHYYELGGRNTARLLAALDALS